MAIPWGKVQCYSHTTLDTHTVRAPHAPGERRVRDRERHPPTPPHATGPSETGRGPGTRYIEPWLPMPGCRVDLARGRVGLPGGCRVVAGWLPGGCRAAGLPGCCRVLPGCRGQTVRAVLTRWFGLLLVAWLPGAAGLLPRVSGCRVERAQYIRKTRECTG